MNAFIGRRGSGAIAATPAQAEPVSLADPVGFRPRFWALNVMGAGLVAAACLGGYGREPFAGANAPLCWMIVAATSAGLACIYLGRWPDALWIARNITKLALVGTVIGFILALSGVAQFRAGDQSSVAPMMSAVFTGMGVSLYATLLGLIGNLWLRLNLRLLTGRHDG
ncbi:MAG: MotA/TolQ/ExbB proton channel family protein [Dongiaceae bacterium]